MKIEENWKYSNLQLFLDFGEEKRKYNNLRFFFQHLIVERHNKNMKNVSFVTNTMTYRCFLNDLLLKGSHQSNPEESMKER